MVRLNYMMWLRKDLGCAYEDILLPPSIGTLDDLFSHLENRSPEYRRVFSQRSVIFADVGGSVIDHSHSIDNIREINLFSPIVGG